MRVQFHLANYSKVLPFYWVKSIFGTLGSLGTPVLLYSQGTLVCSRESWEWCYLSVLHIFCFKISWNTMKSPLSLVCYSSQSDLVFLVSCSTVRFNSLVCLVLRLTLSGEFESYFMWGDLHLWINYTSYMILSETEMAFLQPMNSVGFWCPIENLLIPRTSQGYYDKLVPFTIICTEFWSAIKKSLGLSGFLKCIICIYGITSDSLNYISMD